MNSPVGLAPLSPSIPPAGGIVLDLIGTNGGRIEADLGPNHLFQGVVSESSKNPLVLGSQPDLNAQTLQTLGGGLSAVGVRLTMLQGATGPGESQQHSDFLLLNGMSFGDLSDVATEQTDTTGQTTLSVNSAGGFRTDSLDTGFFSSTNPTLLASLYQSIVQTGQVTYALQYRQPMDQVLDFRDGLDHALANPVQPVILAFNSPVIESITTNSPIDEGGTASIAVTAEVGSQSGSLPSTLTYQFDLSNNGVYSVSNQSGLVSVSFPRPGLFDVPVRVVTTSGSFALGQARIDILNVAPSIAIAGNQTAVEGSPKSFTLGSFSDPGDDSPWTIQVNWGDGSSPETYKVDHTGSLGSLAHTYGLDGSDTVSVEVTDSLGASSTRTFEVTVQNVPPTIDILSVTSPVKIDQASDLFLTFSDPGRLDTFRLLIQWGDHSSTFADLGVGMRSFATSHPYAAAGKDTVTVTITDHGDGQAVGRAAVLVVAPQQVLSAPTFNPPTTTPEITTLAFFNSSTSKASPNLASPQVPGATLFLPNQGQGFGGLKSMPGGPRRSPGKSFGRSLQELLALLQGNSSSAAGGMQNALAAQATASAFSPFSAASAAGPAANQNSATPGQQEAQVEAELTHGKATRMLMIIVWTLVFRNQRTRVRLGRRTLGDRPPRPR